jgi:hypothetical protein
MRKIIIGLIILGIGSQLLTSCSSSSNHWSQFSKRKYLKNFKVINNENEDTNRFYANEQMENSKHLLASQEVDPTQFLLDENKEVNYLKELNPNKKSGATFKKTRDKKVKNKKNRSDKILTSLVKNESQLTPSDLKKRNDTPQPKEARKVPLSIIISLLCIFPGIFLFFPFFASPFFAIAGLRKISKNPTTHRGTGWGVLAISLFFTGIIILLGLLVYVLFVALVA